jgi:hypothetical protein
MAAGKCILKTRGQEYALGRPEIISAAQAFPAYPSLARWVYQSRDIQQFLWVHLIHLFLVLRSLNAVTIKAG